MVVGRCLMVVYALQTEKCDAVSDWILQTQKRSKEKNFLKNPFEMQFKTYLRKEETLIVFGVEPKYPNFSIFGWMLSFAILFIWGWSFWVIPGFIIGLLGVFWTANFYFLMSKMGLRKAGYKGFIKKLKPSQIIKEIIF